MLRNGSMRTRVLPAVAAAATLAVVAGCSSASNSSSASSGSSSSSSSSSASSSNSGGSASGGGSSSSPVTIMSWNSLANPEIAIPETKTAMEARVQAVNASGGINGHPVKLIFCDTNFNPNTEAGCARQAITDHVAAVVGAASYFPDAPVILGDAGIPLIGARGAGTTEFTAPTSFPMDGGNYSWGTGQATLASSLKLTSVGIVSSATPTSDQQTTIIADKLKQLGISVAHIVDAPIGAATQTATAAKVSSGVQGIIMDPPPVDALKVMQALTLMNYKGVVITPSTDLTPSFLTALGSKNTFQEYAVGLVLPPTDTANSMIAEFRQEMNAEDPSMPKDEDALTFWTAMLLFQKIATPLKVIDAKTVLAAMNAAKSVNLGGIVPPYSVAGNNSPVPSVARLFSYDVLYDKVANETITPLTGNFIDPFTVK